MKKNIVIIIALVMSIEIVAGPADIYVFNNSQSATLTVGSTTIAPNEIKALSDVKAPAAFTINATQANIVPGSYKVKKSQAGLYNVKAKKSAAAKVSTAGLATASSATPSAPKLSLTVKAQSYSKVKTAVDKNKATATEKQYLQLTNS